MLLSTLPNTLPSTFVTTRTSWFNAPIYAPGYLIQRLAVSARKHFCLGGMAVSEWTCSIRAIRDTLVEDYSAPGVNTTRRIAYRPPIAVSLFLLALSVSYFKQTLWRWGRLWPYVRMSSLGTGLHRDCNATGDAAKISPCVPSTLSSRSIERRWEDMILPSREDPHNCVDPRSETKVGKDRVCIFDVWQDEMKMRCSLSTPGSPEYILRIAHSTSVTPVSPYTHLRSFTMYLEAMIELVWRCTWRPRSSELRDALGGRNRSSLEMLWEALIERVWRCTWRLRSSELRDALWGSDQAGLEMHWQAIIKQDWRSTWRRSIWREARRQRRLYL